MILADAPHVIHLPKVGAAPEALEPANIPFGMNGQAWQLAKAIQTDRGQNRATLMPDELLVRVAQWRANDMQLQNYFAHDDPDGVSPNELARAMGAPLPSWYMEHGNNIESIAGNQQTAAEALEGFWESEGHRRHVFGTIPFFSNQWRLGVGYAERRDGLELHSTVWVVITV